MLLGHAKLYADDAGFRTQLMDHVKPLLVQLSDVAAKSQRKRSQVFIESVITKFGYIV